MISRCLCIFLFVFGSSFLKAQHFFTPKSYPTGCFANPLHIPMELVGNFGECRPNHFHSGIDIRTGGKENLPVYAIGEGYVSRIKIEPKGFGNALFITHPNGYTSVYAHLNKFFPLLEDFIRKKQYETKKWQQDISLAPQQFPVMKGQYIANSGNTGSSQGPHLHLEIRNTKTENPLNPLLFFTTLKDTKPPVIRQLAVYDSHQSIYEQQPLLFPILKGKLKKDTLIIASTSLYLGLVGDDFMEVSRGTLGIYEMRMYVDDQPYFSWQMDDISYDVTRYMNAFADYKTRVNGGPWIQLCHQLPNNNLEVYKDPGGNKGVITFTSSTPKKIVIEVADTKNNIQRIQFYIQSKMQDVVKGASTIFKAGKENTYKSGSILCNFPRESFYDHVHFETNSFYEGGRMMYQVSQTEIPLHHEVDLYLKPDFTVPSIWKVKMALRWHSDLNQKDIKGMAAVVDREMLKVKMKEFGTFEMVLDTIPPQILTTLKNGMNISNIKRLSVEVKDDITSIQTCEAFVDEEWLRLVQKGNIWYYELDEHFPGGTHTFTVRASDENNNIRTISLTLKR